jgi:ferrous iron transport protein A
VQATIQEKKVKKRTIVGAQLFLDNLKKSADNQKLFRKFPNNSDFCKMKLTDLKMGQKATIVSIDDAIFSNRLLEMGCLPGEELEVIHFAPYGDPIAIKILGYSLALRKSEAETIEVVPSIVA